MTEPSDRRRPSERPSYWTPVPSPLGTTSIIFNPCLIRLLVREIFVSLNSRLIRYLTHSIHQVLVTTWSFPYEGKESMSDEPCISRPNHTSERSWCQDQTITPSSRQSKLEMEGHSTLEGESTSLFCSRRNKVRRNQSFTDPSDSLTGPVRGDTSVLVSVDLL